MGGVLKFKTHILGARGNKVDELELLDSRGSQPDTP